MKKTVKNGCILAVAVCFVISFVSCGRVSGPSTNVVIITLDTVRADRIGCYGYKAAKTPNIDKLAGEGILFENAFAQVPITLPSHTSILTGLHPPRHGIHLNGPYVLPKGVETITTVLKREGYDTAAFLSAYVLDSQFGLSRGFDVYEDNFKATEKITNPERIAGDTAEKALSWLNGEHKKPFFMWVHFFDPHRPYQAPEPYRSQFKDNAYDGEIAYTDEMVGRIIDALDKKGLKESTLVIVVADHGEGLGDHDELTHSFYAYDATLKVPLIMRFPVKKGEEKKIEPGTRNKMMVETVDIMPTVLNLLGVSSKTEYDGRSVQDTPDPDRFGYAETWYPLSFGWSSLLCARTEEWKYIRAPEPELYNIAQDPGELKNLHDTKPEIVKQMRGMLDSYVSKAVPPESGTAIADPEKMRKLGSLGYVASSAKSVEALKGLDLPDPKSRLHVFKTINKAHDLVREEESGEVIEMLLPLVETESSNPIFLQVLGSAYINKRDFESGIKLLRKFYKLDPDNLESSAVLGAALLENGKPNEALEILSACVERMPDYAKVWDQIGIANGVLGEMEKSLRAGGRAVTLEPLNPVFRKNLGVSYMKSGKMPEAEASFRAGLHAAGDDDMDLLYHLGLSLNRQSKYTPAIEVFEKAFKIDPDHKLVQTRLVEAYYNSGKKEKAGKMAEKLVAAEQASPVARFYLGKVLAESGKSTEALPHLDAAMKGMPKFPPAYIALARALIKADGTKEQRAAFLKFAQDNRVALPADLSNRLKANL